MKIFYFKILYCTKKDKEYRFCLYNTLSDKESHFFLSEAFFKDFFRAEHNAVVRICVANQDF